MNRPASCFPSPEEGLRLHLRLCDLDPIAPADLCRAYLPLLLEGLATGFTAIDTHLRESAAHDALLHYSQNPHTYDPERMDLAAYLRMAARGDLLNLLAAEQRRLRKRSPWSVVELGEDDGNIPGREEEPSVQLERAEETERCRALLRSVRESCSEAEKQVLDLLLKGERSNEACAELLGVAGLSRAERDQEVKRVKDRLKKRLERAGGDHD